MQHAARYGQAELLEVLLNVQDVFILQEENMKERGGKVKVRVLAIPHEWVVAI